MSRPDDLPGTDGCSVPSVFRPLLPAENDDERMVCDLHDELYHGDDPKVDRAAADRRLYENLVAVGMPKWKATLYWFGVRIGGWAHWKGGK